MNPVVDLRSDTVTRPTAAMRAFMATRAGRRRRLRRRPERQRAAGEDRGAARQGGGALRRQRHAEQPGGDHEPLRPRRRVHRRPDGAHLPLGRRRRGGARQRPAAAARARGRRLAWRSERIEAAIKPDDAHFAQEPPALPREHDRRQGAAAGLPRGGDARWRAAAAWRPISTARASSTPRSSCGVPARGAGARRSTASRSASRRAWARRSARRWSARRTSSPRRTAGARWSAAACARPASSPPRRCYALEHHVDRLAEDHALAARLAEGLQGLPGLTVEPPQTNIVFADLEGERAAGLMDAPEVARRARDRPLSPALRHPPRRRCRGRRPRRRGDARIPRH